MQETRQNKIARLLQKELSVIFQQQTQHLHGTPEHLPQRTERGDYGEYPQERETNTL